MHATCNLISLLFTNTPDLPSHAHYEQRTAKECQNVKIAEIHKGA